MEPSKYSEGLRAFRFFPLGRHSSISAWMTTIVLSFSLASLVGAGPLTFEKETQRLLARLSDATEDETRARIRRLGEIGPEARAALPALVGLAKQDKFQMEVTTALASMGGEAIGTLRDGLCSGNDLVRQSMLYTIGNMRHDAEPLVPDIIELTHDKNDSFRRHAVGALGRLRLLPAITTPAMAAMLASENPHDAASAADAFWEMGPAAESAIPALEKAAIQHADPYVRCRAMNAIAVVDTAGKAAVRALSHGLRDKDFYGGWSFPISVQRIAVNNLTLKASKASPAAPILLEILKGEQIRDNIWRYEDVSSILASLGIVDAASIFQRDLSFEREDNQHEYDFFSDRTIPPSYEATCIRTSAAAALARLKNDKNAKSEAIVYLETILEDKQWSVVAPVGAKGAQLLDPRAVAATGLGLLDDDAFSALPSLKRAMNKGLEENTDLGTKAAWAIARIDSKDRSCVKALLSDSCALSHPRHWTPTMRSSPFHQESPEDVVRILGTRIDDVLPAIINAALISDANSRTYYVNVLNHAGPVAIQAFVSKAFQVIESPEGRIPKDGGLFESVFRFDSYRANDSLGRHAEPAIDTLIHFLESDNHLARAEAARMLGVIGREPGKVLPLLRRLLKDNRVLVRARAAQAIGHFGSDATPAVADLHQLSSDGYAWVQNSAAKALMAISNSATESDRRK